MFSETRYAMNGDLRVAYRASHEGPRDIVFVPNWSTCCDLFPEVPSLQGWVEAMSSLGRLIFFDQPGTGASDPVEPGALPTLEQWSDSITAVLDDLGSHEANLVASCGASGMTFDPSPDQRRGRRSDTRNYEEGTMYRFLAGLFAGFAITHLGFALFADMNSVRIFGRTWSAGAVWGEVVVYSALTLVFAYLGWRTKTSGSTRA